MIDDESGHAAARADSSFWLRIPATRLLIAGRLGL